VCGGVLSVKRKSKVANYILLHAGILFLSLSGIVSKTAAGAPFLSTRFILLYGLLLLMLFVYAILWQQILKRMKLTTAYYNKAIAIVWGILWGKLFFDEEIKWNMILGGMIVFIGIYLVVAADESDSVEGDTLS
jgi:drug/metabolite transporter (DMT)-like permease